MSLNPGREGASEQVTEWQRARETFEFSSFELSIKCASRRAAVTVQWFSEDVALGGTRYQHNPRRSDQTHTHTHMSIVKTAVSVTFYVFVSFLFLLCTEKHLAGFICISFSVV